MFEAIVKDRELDIDARDALTDEAHALIHEEHGHPEDDPVARGQVDAIRAALNVRILKHLDEDELATASEAGAGEEAAAAGEITVQLPLLGA